MNSVYKEVTTITVVEMTTIYLYLIPYGKIMYENCEIL